MARLDVTLDTSAVTEAVAEMNDLVARRRAAGVAWPAYVQRRLDALLAQPAALVALERGAGGTLAAVPSAELLCVIVDMRAHAGAPANVVRWPDDAGRADHGR